MLGRKELLKLLMNETETRNRMAYGFEEMMSRKFT